MFLRSSLISLRSMLRMPLSSRARIHISCGLALVCLLRSDVILSTLSAAEKPTPKLTREEEEFFESQVRPMLVNHCIECHGAKQQEAGLRLDSRALMMKGSESAPVVVLGQPEKSRLIAVTRYDGDIQMPPKGKLPDKDLAVLARWVKMGVPWPETQVASASPVAGPSMEARFEETRAKHWSYQPLRRPEIPAASKNAWCANPIDAFILEKLQSQALIPSARADKRTLLRRAKFDLLGLPPTAEEVAEFERDTSPDAFANVIDRYLASPHYGERWARHWLDVARYADTKGYVFTEERRYPYAYTYRDYVVQAFNADLPYDQFVLEQLAADQLPAQPHNASLAALGFLTLGRRFGNNQQDIIDDRIDVVTRGLMGMTVTCARCHDHKYDPIPTDDYYSLYGVFASCVEPKEPPLIGMPQETAEYAAYMKELASREKVRQDYYDEKFAELEEELRGKVGEYLAALAREKLDKEHQKDFDLVFNPGELRPQMVRRWRDFILQTTKKHHPVLTPWNQLAALSDDDFAQHADEVIARFKEAAAKDPAKRINPLVLEALEQQKPDSMAAVAKIYDEVFAKVYAQWKDSLKLHENKERLPIRLRDDTAEEVREVLYVKGSPVVLDAGTAAQVFARDVNDKLRKLQKSVDELKVTSPAAPPRAMVLEDAANPTTPRVFLRGNPGRPGNAVPRQFPRIVAGDDRQPFMKGSGRLELAQAIVRPDNPLTSRVLVNRVWLHHFGAGLVHTPSDFGTRSDPPSHPELLDYLASTFIAEGWSIKQLHRQIMLSSTWQQASDDRPEGSRVDPENRLLWRMNRQRLDFEAARDSLLAVSGSLDEKFGGRPVDLLSQPFTNRRTIYGLIDRQDLPGLFRVFDFANPDVSNDQRPQTTVPQQALFVMNSPFVVEQARKLAARSEIVASSEPAQRIEALYRLVFARAPQPEEVELGLTFISTKPQTPEKRTPDEAAKTAKDDKKGDPNQENKPSAPVGLSAWEEYAQALLLTNEFMFVD